MVAIFYRDTGENLRVPIHREVAIFFVLSETRVRPFPRLGSFFVFRGTFVDAAACFADVNGGFLAFTMEFVNTFAFTLWWLCLVFRA